jgi:periplasmic protein TonB
MFEDLDQITNTNPAKRFFTVCTSIALHFVGVIVVIVIPLIVFQKLPQSELLTFLVAPPPPPPAPVAPPPPPTMRPMATKMTVVDPTKFVAPSAMPTAIPEASEEIQQFAAGNFVGGMPSGVSGGVAGAGVGSGLTSGLISNTGSNTPPPPPPPIKKREVYKIGGDLKESMLIKQVKPEYPPLAARMRLSDVVILVVTIDEEGNVSDIKVQKGNPILNEAAIKAVKQWKYSPTVLNGEPVPVIGTVKVIFSSKATQ